MLSVAGGAGTPRLMSVGLIAPSYIGSIANRSPGTLRCTVKPATARPIFRARLTRWMTIVSRSFLTEAGCRRYAGPVRCLYSGEVCTGGGIIEQRLPLTV
ncbi:hypothetical protein KCP69_13685 [Salmonella enterica subsp. enterica]|nr:hypothetical protein KCP69_13685 [Salmonella enterica subsp. enterica]